MTTYTLKDSEMRYRRLFETAQDGILILNAETGEIEDVNPYLINMLGYSYEEFIQKKLWDVAAFKNISINQHAFATFQAAQTIRYEDLLLKTKDGGLVQVEFVSNVYLVGDKRVIQCNIRDITERHRVQQSAFESQQRYRTVLNSMMEGCQIIDYDWRYIYVNDAAAKHGRKTPVELLMHTMMDVYPGIESTAFFRSLQVSMEERTRQRLETQFFYADGSFAWFEFSIQPVPEGIFVLSIDITERKQTGEMQSKLAAIVESSDDGMFSTRDWLITSWNHGAEQLYGYTANEVIGQSITLLIPEDRSNEFTQIVTQMALGKSVKNLETVRLRKDGTSFDVSLTISPIQDASGKLLGTSVISRDITERKRAEDVWAKLAAIVEYSGEAIIGTTPDRIITSWNLGAERLYGYSARQVIGKPTSFLIPDDRKDELVEIHRNVLLGESVRNVETSRLRKDGVRLDISLTVSPIKDTSGRVVGVSAIAHDISERKAREELNARLSAIVESSDDAIIGKTLDGVVTSWNRGAENLYEYSANEMIGQPISLLIPPDRPDELPEILAHLKRGESIKHFETIRLRKDGTWLDVSLTISPIKNASGEMIGASTIAHDITERKRSEALIRESDNRFRALLQNSADAITLLDTSGVVIYDSPAAPGILGYAPDEWLGQDIFELVHPDDLPEVRTLFGTLTQKASARLSSAFRVRHKNRFWVWVEAVATNLLDQPGINAIVLNYRDITKRRQADEKLRSAREFLQSVQDALSAHIAILDHNGVIVQVNTAWRDFGQENGLLSSNYCIGMNYLEICDNANGDFSEQGQLMSNAIRGVLKNSEMEISLEYPCHAPTEQRWFVARITSFENNDSKWLVVAHTNITERKLVEIEVQQRLSELEVLYQSGLAFSNLLDPQKIAQKMIDLLAHKMHWYHTTIRLYHAESESLEILAFNMSHLTSSKEQAAAKKRLMKVQHPNQGLSGWVIQHAELLRINDLQKDERYFETFSGLQSGLYVPIKVGERVLGVISIESEHRLAFHKSDERLVETLAAQVAIALQNAQLFEQLTRSNLDLVSAYNATIEGWSRALDLRDKETEGHSLRVTEMSLKLAQAIGLSEDELAQIRWGALLHDIGKMGIPDGILLKPGPLTDDEWQIMKKHPTFAYGMLLPIQYLHRALDIPYCHHEKWDGSGYPRGLKGEQIPLAARIFSVVDVWDALKSDRPYRAGWEDQKVRDYLHASAGTHFAPNIVETFLKILE